ncbi:MAG: nucleotidyltransferase [Deltaproteobacteria bacterium]|nr:nucleotidyltransferase [Deltaproteobacteria bacterium]
MFAKRRAAGPVDTRLKDIDMHLETLEQALALLEEVLAEPFSALVRDAAIHRFEYTFELSWKLLKRIALVEGQKAESPWQAIRAAAEAGLLQNVDLWFEMVECRNSATMTFMPDISDQVFKAACSLPSSLRFVISAAKKKYFGKT